MGKQALITGATGKIGRVACVELARAGFDVAIHYNRSEQLAWEISKNIEELGCKTMVVRADLADEEQCGALEERVYKEMGRLDAFINCASVFVEMPLGQVSLDEWDELMAINVRAAFYLSQSIGLKMRNEEGGGSIVHFSDIAATHSYAHYLPYCISRIGIDAMVKGFAAALAPQVRVNAIAPYLVKDVAQMTEDDRKRISKIPLKRATNPREIARLVRLLVEPDCTITGQTLVVDGGRSLAW